MKPSSSAIMEIESAFFRVRKRSFQKFGNRMLPGGDLHEREETFFDMVGSRTEYYVEEWVQSLSSQISSIV